MPTTNTIQTHECQPQITSSEYQDDPNVHPSRWVNHPVRYGLERAAGCACLIGLSPVMAAIAVSIYAETRENPVFTQWRMGKDGEWFKIHKWRTLRGDDHKTPSHGIEDDRATKVGGFLRRTGLDETLNSLDIARGKMALVGLRPPTEEHLQDRQDELGEEYPLYLACQTAAKPGIFSPVTKFNRGLTPEERNSAETVREETALAREFIETLTPGPWVQTIPDNLTEVTRTTMDSYRTETNHPLEIAGV